MKQRIIDPPKDQWERLPNFDGLTYGLTDGERTVYNLFDEKLPIQWEMYIQPYLNGLRPDLVLLNPSAGIAVFEVKDWKLSTIETFVKSEYVMKNPLDKIRLYKEQILKIYCPRLKGLYGDNATATVTAGLIFSMVSEDELQKIFGRTDDGKLVCRIGNPDSNLRPLYAQFLKLSKYYPLVGKETLVARNLDELFPEWKRDSIMMKEDTAKDLRGWLKDPAFSQELRQPLDIKRDSQVNEIIENNRKAKYRRVKGSAGSGKSLTLAMRAAELASQNKKVLVCSYNITLINYLRPLAYRHASDLASKGILKLPEVIRHKIVFLNFHAWCKRVCIDSGREKDHKRLWQTFNQLKDEKKKLLQGVNNTSDSLDIFVDKNDLAAVEQQIEDEEKKVLNSLLPKLVQEIYNDSGVNTPESRQSSEIHLFPSQTSALVDSSISQNNSIPMVAEETNNDILPSIAPPLYDAILVDEGQDYLPIWWQTLRKALKADGEMLLVADKTQNIYGTAQAWTEDTMKGAGFSGDWMRLKTSYRIPPKLEPILINFANDFLIPKIRHCQGIDVDINDVIDIPDVEQFSFEDINVELNWIHVPNPTIAIDICFEAVHQYMLNLPKDTAIADIVFLAQTNENGLTFVNKCKQKEININHTFGEDDQRKKLAFFLDHSTIKATTLHSFKGWEGRLLVLHVNNITSDKDCALFYTALTRLKKHPYGSKLTVVSSSTELQDFGYKNFSIFEEKSTVNKL